MAPDSGYFPGGVRRFSDRAHHVQPGATATALLRSAQSQHQRSFAYGWISHALLDQTVHPSVNARVAELRGGEADELEFDADPGLHVRVELGLDAAVARSQEPLPVAGRLAATDVDWVHQTMNEVQEFPERDDVKRSLRALTRGLPWLGRHVRFVSRRVPLLPPTAVDPVEVNLGAMAALRPFLLWRTDLQAWLRPIASTRELLGAAMKGVDDVVEKFEQLHLDEFEGVPDADLDTGRIGSRMPVN